MSQARALEANSESFSDPERARESLSEPERVRESQRESERARESQREPERDKENLRESLWLALSVALSGAPSGNLSLSVSTPDFILPWVEIPCVNAETNASWP